MSSTVRQGRFRGVLLALPAIVVVGSVFLIPVFWISYLSFTDPSVGLHNYEAILTDGISLPTIVRTLRMALIVTVVCLILAYPYAYAMTVASPRARLLLAFFILLPFWTSLMARTFAWVVLLQDRGPLDSLSMAVLGVSLELRGTAVGVTIAMAQLMMPFMVLPLYSRLQSIDLKLVDAAQTLGASRVTSFRTVYFPLSMPGVVAGAMLVFVISIGFYVTPALLAARNQQMISQLIAIKTDPLFQFGAAGALSLVVLVVTAVCLAIAGLAPRIFGRISSQRN